MIVVISVVIVAAAVASSDIVAEDAGIQVGCGQPRYAPEQIDLDGEFSWFLCSNFRWVHK